MPNTDDDANKQYNDLVVSTGSWIDAEFLEQVLSATLEDDIKVVDFQISAAVGVGDNYLSILYKTAVQFTTGESDEQRERHLMIKGKPTAQVFIEMIENMGVFRKEITMYGQCLPAMHRELRKYFPKNTPYVAPDSYKCSREDTLVMEDLGESGYKMANRRNQLDFEHCIATLRTLARFHALSAKVYEKDPDMVIGLASEAYVEENREKMSQFLEACFHVLALVVDTWGERARFAPILREFGDSVWDILQHVVRSSENFNVLNHGDMWVNNIMYKYTDDGRVENAKLVDFQLSRYVPFMLTCQLIEIVSRYSTPALDLHYFLFTSPQPSVLSEHMFELLEIYHQALMADLAVLGIDVDYSLEQLHKDMQNRAAFGLLAIVQILPHIVAPPSEVFDLDNFASEVAADEHPLMTNFKNPQYQAIAGSYLEHMEAVGYLQEATRAKNSSEPVGDLSLLSRLRSTIRRIISLPVCQ